MASTRPVDWCFPFSGTCSFNGKSASRHSVCHPPLGESTHRGRVMGSKEGLECFIIAVCDNSILALAGIVENALREASVRVTPANTIA